MRAIPVLLYHRVTNERSADLDAFTVSPRQFEEHLDVLDSGGWLSPTISDFVADGHELGGYGGHVAPITFDDGYVDNVEVAAPLLAQRGRNATLYVTTELIDGVSTWLPTSRDRGMSWSQVSELADNGWEIGAHSLSHPMLDVISREVARSEIGGSRRILEDRLSTPVDSFAYPHGYYDDLTRQAVIDAGFTSACAVKNALSHSADDVFAIARITVMASTTAEELEKVLCGSGVKVAPDKERVVTKAWREVRRARHRMANAS